MTILLRTCCQSLMLLDIQKSGNIIVWTLIAFLRFIECVKLKLRNAGNLRKRFSCYMHNQYCNIYSPNKKSIDIKLCAAFRCINYKFDEKLKYC